MSHTSHIVLTVGHAKQYREVQAPQIVVLGIIPYPLLHDIHNDGDMQRAQ